MIINKGQKVDGDPNSGAAPEVNVPESVVTPVQAVKAQTTSSETSQLMDLVKALLESTKIAAAREARLARAEEEEEVRKRNRDAQYARNRQGEDQSIINTQSACKHLKGGKHRKKTANKDYAVYLHRFIDNSQYVKCFLCKMKWYPTDTIERIVRGGRVLVNHTGIGWREALLMMEDSTNTPSMSEIPQDQWARVHTEDEIPNTISPIAR